MALSMLGSYMIPQEQICGMVITWQCPGSIIILDTKLLESKANVEDFLLFEDLLDGQGILLKCACVRIETGLCDECIKSLLRAPSFST